MTKRKIALFGGTFDPIHLGHTAVAAVAAEKIGAEKIVFIPAKQSPLKGFFPIASDDDRLRMAALAIAENRTFELSDYELKKSGPSYTIETVRQFQDNYGSDTIICWLLGADSVDELPHWYNASELCDECNLCTMYRAGLEPPDFTKFKDIWGRQRVEKLQQNIIQTPLVDISSTKIRNRLAVGEDISDMVHPAVADYIKKNRLYIPQANS